MELKSYDERYIVLNASIEGIFYIKDNYFFKLINFNENFFI